MCKQLAQHGKQSYPSIIATLRLGSFSFIQRDYDALVPFLRNHSIQQSQIVLCVLLQVSYIMVTGLLQELLMLCTNLRNWYRLS